MLQSGMIVKKDHMCEDSCAKLKRIVFPTFPIVRPTSSALFTGVACYILYNNIIYINMPARQVNIYI